MGMIVPAVWAGDTLHAGQTNAFAADLSLMTAEDTTT